jgi:hypothetical protein
MKLGEISCIHKHMPHADFWIIRTGTRVGQVALEYDADNIGIMFTGDAILKRGVMPNKIKVWFQMVYNATGGPVCSTIERTSVGEEISIKLLKQLRLPVQAVPQ